jgi:hypothetical protein
VSVRIPKPEPKRLGAANSRQRVRQWSKLLKLRSERLRDLSIDGHEFSDLVYRLARECDLPRLKSRPVVDKIIEAYFLLYKESQLSSPPDALIRAKRDLKVLSRRKLTAPMRSLKDLRRKWACYDPEREWLWKGLLEACNYHGISAMSGGHSEDCPRFVCYARDGDGDFATRLQSSFKTAIKLWNDGFRISRGPQRPQEPLRRWIARMADVFLQAGGGLPKIWASYDRSQQLHTGPFVDFLSYFYSFLPKNCRPQSEAAFRQQIEFTQKALVSEQIKLKGFYLQLFRWLRLYNSTTSEWSRNFTAIER